MTVEKPEIQTVNRMSLIFTKSEAEADGESVPNVASDVSGYQKLRDFPQVYRTPDGYMVSARRIKLGLNERRFFPTLKEALDFRSQILENLKKYGGQPDVPKEVTLRADLYGNLLVRLAPFGKRPEDAVDQFIKFLGEETIRLAKPTIGQLVDQYHAHKLIEKRGKGYINELKTHCNFIKRTWGERRIDDLRKNEIDTALTKAKPHKGTRGAYLRHIKMFFNWVLGEDKGYIVTNPAEGLRYKHSFEREFYSVDASKNFMAYIAEHHKPLVGYYALLLFAGLRPTEGARVEWKHIDFSTEVLHVVKGKTDARHPHLRPVAMAWVKWHKEHSAKHADFVPKKNLFNLERKARTGFRRLNQGHWIADGLRHTFATFYRALTKSDNETAWYMGNSPQMIKKHYAQSIPHTDLDSFWGLTPDTVLRDAAKK